MMDDEADFRLSYDQAVSMLPDGDYIHTFLDGEFLLGADWMRDEILKGLREVPERAIYLTGPMATGMGHGLCFWNGPTDNGYWVFVETK
ncbi:MAG: hypothetical protein WC710_14100 [Gallionella sp.]|jgi:hypothetical protein